MIFTMPDVVDIPLKEKFAYINYIASDFRYENYNLSSSQ